MRRTRYPIVKGRIQSSEHHNPPNRRTPDMNFQQLLQQRDALLRQVRLANTAYAYRRLGDFAGRIARARLHGAVTLRPGDPLENLPWPELVAEEGSQSVIAEHFLDEEIIELADLLAFVSGHDQPAGCTFRLEELGRRFLPGLRRELEQAGVALEPDAPTNQGHRPRLQR
jgi:hypothetical protein